MNKKKLNLSNLLSINDDLFQGKDILTRNEMKSIIGGFEPTYNSIKTYNTDTSQWQWDTGVHDDSPPGTQYT